MGWFTMKGWFVFCQGSGAILHVHDSMVLGRGFRAEGFTSDPLLSREHCRLSREGSKLIVEDLGSKNRTRVNDRTLASGERVQLQVEDVIKIGSQRLVITPDRNAAPRSARHSRGTQEVRRHLEQTPSHPVILDHPEFRPDFRRRDLGLGKPWQPIPLYPVAPPRPRSSGTLGWLLLFAFSGALFILLKGLPA